MASPMSGDLWRDLRLGLRSLGRSRALSAVVVLSLALGLGAATTVFVFVDKVLLEPLPVRDPERLVALFGVTAGSDRFLQTSYPNYRDLRDRNRVLSGLAASQWTPLNLTEGDPPEQIVGQLVSAEYFDVLGVAPALGRGFLPEEDRGRGGSPVVVLSHRLWQRRYGSDPGVVGRAIEINGRRFTVVGVAPAGFRGRGRLDPTEAWVPMSLAEVVFPWSEHVDDRGWGLFFLVGRLAPGVSVGAADAAMKALAARLAEEHPEANEGRSLAVLPAAESAAVDPATTRTYARVGRLFAAASGLLLLIACANAANLLLVRARHRRGEIAMRLALGARRGQLVRQLLAESTPLFLLAGLAALPLAALGRAALLRVRPSYWAEGSVDLALDGRILAFTLGAALATALLFGLWPALRASGTSPLAALRDDGAASGRQTGRAGASRLLVVAQIGLSLVSLILAGLFVRSFREAQAIEPGFDAERLMVVSFEPAALGHDRERGLALAQQVVERVEGLPGVESAAVSGSRLLSPVVLRRSVSLPAGEGPAAGEPVLVATAQVGPGYFETLGIALREGRPFAPSDRQGAPAVAVVNETMARRFWPDGPAVGRRFSIGGEEGETVEVVGVAADSRYRSLTEDPEPYLYLPLLQDPSGTLSLYVRAAGDPAGLVKPVTGAVQEVAPRLPLLEPRTVGELVAGSLLTARTGYVVLALFGGTAMLLALAGTYGAVTDWVGRRRREIAIRGALGATPPRVTRMIVGEALRIVAAGVALGIAGAVAAQRLVAGMLYGVDPLDPATYAALALLVAGLALLASLVPARRIAATPSAEALR